MRLEDRDVGFDGNEVLYSLDFEATFPSPLHLILIYSTLGA